MDCASKTMHKRSVVTSVVALLTCLAVSTSFLAQPRDAYADNQNVVAGTDYSDTLSQLDQVTSQYGILASEQDKTFADLQAVREKIAENEAHITDVQQQIEQHQADLAAKRDILAQNVADDYKSGGVGLLSILLSSSTFEDAVSRIYYYSAVSQAQASKIEAVSSAKTELENRQGELKRLEDELHEEEASIETLYEQQRAQAEEMHQQQLKAAELLSSIPAEAQSALGEEGAQLVAESQYIVQTAEENKASGTKTNTNASNEQAPAADAGQSETHQEETSHEEANTQPVSQDPAPSYSDGSLQALLNSAYATGPTRADWGCSGWVYIVFKNAGICNFSGSAADFANTWCYSSNRADLRPGMVVAVPTHAGTAAGRIYGHVGIYMGDNTVRDYAGGSVRMVNLDTWIETYSTIVDVRWGWCGGVVLS